MKVGGVIWASFQKLSLPVALRSEGILANLARMQETGRFVIREQSQ